MKRLIFVLIIMVLCIGVSSTEPAKWKRPDEVITSMIDQSSNTVTKLLPSICTQEQIDQIESALFPEPSDAEKKAAIERARNELMRSGMTEMDSVCTTLKAESDKIVIREEPVDIDLITEPEK